MWTITNWNAFREVLRGRYDAISSIKQKDQALSRMARRISCLILALIATLLFFLAIGYNGWECSGIILGSNCKNNPVHETTGALLLTAGLLVFAAAIFIIFLMLWNHTWSNYMAAAVGFIAAILAIAALFYYFSSHKHFWSPFIATIAMSLTIALAISLITDLIGDYY